VYKPGVNLSPFHDPRSTNTHSCDATAERGRAPPRVSWTFLRVCTRARETEYTLSQQHARTRVTPAPLSLLGGEAGRHWGQDGAQQSSSKSRVVQLAARPRSEWTCVSLLFACGNLVCIYIYIYIINIYLYIYI